jgi:hypothetical protein
MGQPRSKKMTRKRSRPNLLQQTVRAGIRWLIDGSRPDFTPPLPKGRLIYFIRQDQTGAIKIGSTNNLEKRVQALQTGSPYLLKPIGYITGTAKLEQKLHKQFQEFQLQGEWFQPHPRLLDFIEQKATVL